MANSVYSEITSVSTTGYERDRVLTKLSDSTKDLPYTVDTITISHNDFAVADVINDSIKKLYNNFLYLIANAEISSTNTPTSALPSYVIYDSTGVAKLSATSIHPNTQTDVLPTSALKNLKETHLTIRDDLNKFLLFNYSNEMSFISETHPHMYDNSIVTLLSGNEVEFNKTFKFKNIVSVDRAGDFLFVLDGGDNGNDTIYKFNISGLIKNDPALKRTDLNDTKNPGRYLIKTIGGTGKSQTKNKLNKPRSISIYDNRIYVLDNGHKSLKVFDLDFNFLHEQVRPSLFTGSAGSDLVSIVVDAYSNTVNTPRGYILTKHGKILEYAVDSNTLNPPRPLWEFWDTRLNSLSGIDLSSTFSKIVNSKTQKNILYIANAGKVYKYYKTNLYSGQPISELNLDDYILMTNPFDGSKQVGGIGAAENQHRILSFDTEKYEDVEHIAITTLCEEDTEEELYDNDTSQGGANSRVSTYIVQDNNETIKLYNEDFYTNYFSLSDIVILPQEIVNNITFNKTFKKLIYNHYSFFQALNRKIFSSYQSNSTSVDRDQFTPVATLCTINLHEFTQPESFNEDPNLYIGVNEPILTDVINRPLKKIHKQQQDLFDLIKEEELNSNPPSTYTVKLPGDVEDYPNVVSVNAATATVVAGQDVEINLTRTNYLTAKPPCSVKYYTTAGTATDSDHTVISSEEPSVAIFERDETTTDTIILGTTEFFSGQPKTFTLHIEANTNCIVNPDLSKVDVTINPVGSLYNITLSAATLDINEGDTGRVAIVRETVAGWPDPDTVVYNPDVDSSVQISINPINLTTSEYSPVVAGSDTPQVVTSKFNDFVGVLGETNSQQLSAAQVGSTSTIFFTDEVSSVVFDISAANDLAEDTLSNRLEVEIYNPSEGSNIKGISKQIVTVNEDYKTANLLVSDISANYKADAGESTESDTLLSSVNIWSALSADTGFQTYSASNPYIVNFTVSPPLSVFGISTLSGALYFDTEDTALVYSSNRLNVIIDNAAEGDSDTHYVAGSAAALVGHGGDGGHGALWLSGSDYTSSGDVSASAGYTGEDGGPAIHIYSNYFESVTVENKGVLYGGAGGGGGGVLGLSAAVMPDPQPLSAGCGGGGGGGIHLSGAGGAGIAALNSEEDSGDVQDADYKHIYLTDGNIGSSSGEGGLGGGYVNDGSSPYTSKYPDIGGDELGHAGGNIGGATNYVGVFGYAALTGLSGGSLGEAGQSDESGVNPEVFNGVYTNYDTVSADWQVRTGGNVGLIIDASSSTAKVSSGISWFGSTRL